MKPISVAFVDDHPVLLCGIAHLFKSNPDFHTVGIGHCSGDVVEITRRQQPDVIVVDLTMPGNILDAIAEIVKDRLPTRIVAFTAVTAVEPAIAVLEAGAKGYVLKGSSEQDLIAAICAVHNGETYITPGFAATVVAGMRTAALRRSSAAALRLSTREEQVLRLVLRGKTNREIGTVLALSDKTIKHYMGVLMQRLNARNRIEVVLTAQELGMQSEVAQRPLMN